MFIRIPLTFRLLGLDEYNPLPIRRLGITLLFGRETVSKWRKIVREEPDDIDARLILGSLLRAARRYDEAVGVYAKALQILEGKDTVHGDLVVTQCFEAHIRFDMGNALLTLGRRSEARTEWERVVESGQNGFANEARKQLISFPADGSIPHRSYLLIVVDIAGSVLTEIFGDLDTVWPKYEGAKKAVRTKKILGVGLAEYHPDGVTCHGIWMELPKGESRERIRKVISEYAVREDRA